MMKTMQAICVVVLLIAVALAACASPTQKTTPTPTMAPATSTPTPPPTPTPRLVLPPNSTIYLLAEGEERGHLISAQELEGLPDEVIAPLRQRLEEGEEYRAQLAMQGAEPAVALGVTSRGETTPFALVVTAEGDHPEGTLIMPGANGEPLFLEPLIQGEQGDQIAPVLLPGVDQLTWGLFTKTGQPVALVDQYNRWSTESTLCREFWEQQLPQMGISVEGKTGDQISRMGGDVFFALKLWLADQEAPPASWEQIPNGWQWQELADQKAYEGGDQDGLLAVVVSPDGQVYVAEWDHDWGQDYGYFQEVQDKEGNAKQVPVGARRVEFLASLPKELIGQQLNFSVNENNQLIVRAVGENGPAYVYNSETREWVEIELPTSTPESTPTPSSVYVEYETPENKTISIAEDESNILNFDGSPYTGGDLPGGNVVVLVVGEKTINGVTYYVFETPYGKKLIEIPGQGPATPTPEPVPSYPTVDTSRHFENTQFLTGEWGREGARTSIPIDPSGFEGYFDGLGTGFNIVTHVVQIIDAENGVLLVDGGELGRFRVQLPPQGSDNKIEEPWGRVIRISPNGRRTTTIRLLDDFGVGSNGDIRVGDWLGFGPRWVDVLKMNKTDQRDERIEATRKHIQEWHAQEGGDGVIPLDIFAICR